MKPTVVDKGGVIFPVPQRPMRAFRGVAGGVSPKGLRERKDRF
jgi:hypothetical protein